METKEVNIDSLQPNDYNPNSMPSTMYDHLVGTIDTMGFLQNILVWEKDDKSLVIIDGEHRLRAEKQLGKTIVEAKILTTQDLVDIGNNLKAKGKISIEVTKDEEVLKHIAMTLTVLMNEIKGEADHFKFAQLLNSLQVTFSKDQMKDILNKSQGEIDGYLELLKLSQEEVEKAIHVMKDKQTLNELKLVLTEEQFAIILKALSQIRMKNNNEGITEIAKIYLKTQGVIEVNGVKI